MAAPASVEDEAAAVRLLLEFVCREVQEGGRERAVPVARKSGVRVQNPLNERERARTETRERLGFWLGVAVDVLLAKVYMPVCQREGLLAASEAVVRAAGGDRRCAPLLQVRNGARGMQRSIASPDARFRPSPSRCSATG